jgi:predicted AAA+ superfamily ATPase
LAHIRKRHLELYIEKLLGFSPIVGLLGHRQSGKTTLMTEIVRTYQTMDQRASMQAADSDPDGFIAKLTGIRNGIDECQLSPALFPALKERVRLDKRPGQFILTGSVRFTSKKAIRESLTGRIINVTLHPMVVTELLQISESEALRHFLMKGVSGAEIFLASRKIKAATLREGAKILQAYGEIGGLPGVCFVRDSGLRNQKLSSQLETILDRDLRQIFPTTLSLDALRRVLETLALKNAQPLEWSALSRDCRVSVPTLRKLLSAFESLFLVSFLAAEGSEKKQALIFEDAGELSFLAEGRLNDLAVWSATVISHVRTILDVPLTGHYKYPCRFSQYRTRGGAFVPLVVRCGQKVLGIIPMVEENPGLQVLGSAKSFLKANPEGSVICVHPHERTQLVSKNLLSLPGTRAFL